VFKLDPTGQETVLHNFTGPDGSYPTGRLAADSAGNFYGTTLFGGNAGAGVIFKLDAAGNYSVLHSFTNSDGSAPYGGLFADAAGNFYGTTLRGGPSSSYDGGHGVVYKIDPSGNETVLYSFTGGADGSNPTGSLATDSLGNVYGTTFYGGAANAGVVYTIKP
jgi:uncharacterized repeat protein (TIGR03803 family)